MARTRSNNSGLQRTPLALALALVIAALYFAREVIIPIALAVLLTFLLTPMVRRLERVRAPRGLAVAAAMALALGVAGGMGWIVERQLNGVVEELPAYQTEIVRKIDTLRPRTAGPLTKLSTTLKELGKRIDTPTDQDPGAPGAGEEQAVKPVPVTITPGPGSGNGDRTDGAAGNGAGEGLALPASMAPLVKPATTALLVLVFTVFMLLNREDIRYRFLRLVGEEEMHAATPAIDDAAGRVSRYLLIQVCINGALGVVVGAGMWLIGVPNAALFGLLIGILRFVPYVGVWLAATLIGFVSLASTPGWTQPLLALGLIAAVELAVANFVEPMIIGARTGLSPLAILTAVVFWLWLWGPIGLVLAVPLTVCLAVVGRNVPRLGFLEVLLGQDPVLSPHAQVYQRLLAGDPEEAGQIVDAYAKKHPIPEVFDGLLMPALRMAEADRHRGVLDAEREAGIGEMVGAMVEDLGGRIGSGANVKVNGKTEGAEEAAAVTTMPPPPRGMVLCLPVRDTADEMAARMLHQLLVAEGFNARVIAVAELTGKMAEEVGRIVEDKAGGSGSGGIGAVCISSLPPGETVHVRLLAKRLRKRLGPGVPIIVGLWEGVGGIGTKAETDRAVLKARLEPVGGTVDHVVTTLSEAVAQLRNPGAAVACAVEPGKAGAATAATVAASAAAEGVAAGGNGKTVARGGAEEVEVEAAED